MVVLCLLDMAFTLVLGVAIMIFSPEHIEQIKNVTKTQSRRVNRGVYQVGKDYSVQPGRGKKGIQGLRIVMDDISEELVSFSIGKWRPFVPLSEEDARAEGGYTPIQYEEEFRRLYPDWDGIRRWAFKFHIKEEI